MKKPSTMRVMRGAVATTMVLSSLSVTPPVLAQTENFYEGKTECVGSPISQTPMVDSQGKQYARLEFVYSWKNNLYCARLVHTGESYGQALRTEVELWATTSQGTQTRKANYDAGTYKYYAGPIGARASCMLAIGYIMWKGTGRAAVSKSYCHN